MEEKVSVVVPVHNSEKYLKKCIDSLLKQDYKNIEIITVLNGSTDDSLKILESYKDKIKMIELERSGIGLARNKGIDSATGKYLCFVDSDDEVKSNYISCMVENIKKYNSDLSLCEFEEIHEETGKTNEVKSFNFEFLEKKEIIKNLHNIRFAPWCKLYKKEIIDKHNIKFPIDIKYEDVPFVLKYLKNSKSISRVNKKTYIYNIHKESEQTTVDKRIFDIIEIMKQCEKIIDKKELIDLKVYNYLTFATKTRYIKDSKIRNEFIDKVYNELNKTNWKKCEYYKGLSLTRRIVYSNKHNLKLYCKLYSKFKL